MLVDIDNFEGSCEKVTYPPRSVHVNFVENSLFSSLSLMVRSIEKEIQSSRRVHNTRG